MSLRSFLEREGETAIPKGSKYPYDRFPATVLPGSEAIMPKASKPIDLYDGGMTDSWAKNHRPVYDPRSHAYLQMGEMMTDDEEITVEQARM
jgi:hypothetical protein